MKFDKEKYLKVKKFFSFLKHGIGAFHGKKFELMPWQDDLLKNIFGMVKEDGTRQYKKGYIEIPKKNGKSEFGAGIALYMLTADGEYNAQVYSCAADREQASIVFDVACSMVEQCPALKKHITIIKSKKRMVYNPTNSFYQVLSSEVKTKHGLNVSCCIFDELHAQPNRDLWDVMTSGSGDARRQPLFLTLTTAGNERKGIAWEQHCFAREILDGTRQDETEFVTLYGLENDEDWEAEENWAKANPSLGVTISIDTVREWYKAAKGSFVAENNFKWLRLNMWLNANTKWLNMQYYEQCDTAVDVESLKGRKCYGGLDLSSTSDLTAFVLCFPPEYEGDKYIFLAWMYIPDECLTERVRKDKVPYDVWKNQGYIITTQGNVVDYRYIRRHILEIAEQFAIQEIAYDRYNATEIILNLMDDGLDMVPFGQGFRDMSAPTKELETKIRANECVMGQNPVLRWNFSNIVIRTDPAGNIKADKAKSTEKIDGAVAAIMAFARAVASSDGGSVYEERGMIFV